MSYAGTVQGWHDFFIAVAAAAATLVGLLFVGLSLHLDTVLSRPEVRALARATLATFGLLLISSIFLLTPETQPIVHGFELLISAMVTVVITLRNLVGRRQVGMPDQERAVIGVGLSVRRYGLFVVSYLLVAASGGLLLAGNANVALELTVPAYTIGLSVCLRNTWDLLVTVGAVRGRGIPGKT
jgi:hypothetical protein